MKVDNSKKTHNTEASDKAKEKAVAENKKNNKSLYRNLFKVLNTIALPAILALKKPVDYFLSIKLEKFYGVPRLYFFDNPEEVFLFNVMMAVLIVGILFVPYLLKKSREIYKFKITKMDSIAYAFIISFYTFVIFFYSIINLFQAINYANYFALIISLFTPIIVSIGVFKIIKDYLDLYTKSLTIKNDNGIDKPDDGYKYLTFDFNGAKTNFEQKVRIQIPVGSKISDAVKYINTDKVYSKAKKKGKNLSYWADEKDSSSRYNDVIVTDNFDDEKVLYARYSNKKYKDDNTKTCNYFILATVIALVIIAIILYFNFSKSNPENKSIYELVAMEDGTIKIKICDYKDKVVLMDFEYSKFDKNRKDEAAGKEATENIEIIKGKYIIESIEGKPIQLKKFRKVSVVE